MSMFKNQKQFSFNKAVDSLHVDLSKIKPHQNQALVKQQHQRNFTKAEEREKKPLKGAERLAKTNVDFFEDAVINTEVQKQSYMFPVVVTEK